MRILTTIGGFARKWRAVIFIVLGAHLCCALGASLSLSTNRMPLQQGAAHQAQLLQGPLQAVATPVPLAPGPRAMQPQEHSRASLSSTAHFDALIGSGGLFALIAGFYLAGLALAFTPCCLPMLPLLSGIIVGAHRGSARALTLSASYVIAMASTYAIAGVIAASTGEALQAAFQTPWVIGSFATLFVLLGISMLGGFVLQMPAAIQTRLSALSNHQAAATLLGAAISGALSALIVTACVAPALIGALAFVSRTGNEVKGAAALFAMGLGMGTPLLLLGASAEALLPKPGPWMRLVKQLLGCLLLEVAAILLDRLFLGIVARMLLVLPLFIAASLLSRAGRKGARLHWVLHLTAFVLCVLGSLAFLSDAQFLASRGHSVRPAPALEFLPVHSQAQLNKDLLQARQEHRVVLLDFSASWCEACREMDTTTFKDQAVRAALHSVMLLRADVTDNAATDQALMRKYKVFGPPTMIFWDRSGRQRPRDEIVGYVEATKLAKRAQQVLGN